MHDEHEPKVKIRINEDRITLSAGLRTVSELKSLADPAVPPNDRLWLDVAGGSDIELADDGTIDIVEGLVLYSQGPDGAHPKSMNIVIDGAHVEAASESVTGSILRRLVTPPIADDRDLFRDIDGAPDERIDDDEAVTLRNGAEFYSVPRLIAPGAP